MDDFFRDSFGAGEFIFKAGDAGDCAYVIEEGCVEVLTAVGDTTRRTAVLAAGGMFGEGSLLDGQPRMRTVRAVLPTRLIRFERRHVESLLQHGDPIMRYLLQLLMSRLRQTQALLEAKEPPEVGPADPKTSDVHALALRALTLASDLNAAIDRNQLAAFYQPIMSLEERSLVGFEALIRWRHPTLGLVGPNEFIPLAEKTGIVGRLGEWVLDRALADWEELRSLCNGDGGTPFISVNLSAPEVASEGLVEAVQDTLDRHRTEPSALRVEITETMMITRVREVAASLSRLRALGISIALDDFGTGFAGLDYLQSMPFTSIKIDKSFVVQMAQSERSLQIVKSAIALAERMELGLVAEGIEDEATARSLVEMGCRHGQGYLFGRPMPGAKVAEWAAGVRRR